MTARVFYQPCSDKVARENLQTTILNSVELSSIEDLIEPELLADLKNIYPDGKLWVWGLSSPVTQPAWASMNHGDIVIFNTETIITVSASVTLRTNSKKLALRLWGWKDEAAQNTWENIYFVRDVRHHAIRFKDIQEHLGYRRDRPFYQYSEDQSSALLEHFPELDREYFTEEVTLAEAQQEIQDQATDGAGTRLTRLEHKYIVKHLFQGKASTQCFICQQEFPRHMLVAAHIKKRSVCTVQERLDIENIAVPMCRLGCDTLFELGYLSVKDRQILKHPSREMAPAIASYIDGLIKNPVKKYSPKNRKYFKWHLEAHGFEPKDLPKTEAPQISLDLDLPEQVAASV